MLRLFEVQLVRGVTHCTRCIKPLLVQCQRERPEGGWIQPLKGSVVTGVDRSHTRLTYAHIKRPLVTIAKSWSLEESLPKA